VPRAIERRPVAAVHVADQLRRVAEDGRVELGEAAAFELGRLLALSAPSTVAALREWRRQGYVRRRGARVGGASVLEGLLTHWELALADGAAVALGRRLLETVGDSEVVDRVLPDRPLVDPLPDLDVLADPARTIATGFALPVADVRRSLDRGTRPVLADGHMAPVSAAGFDALRRDASLLQPLKTQLATSVSALTGLTRAFVIRPGGQLVPHGLEEGDAEQEAGVEAQAETAEEAETVEALFPGARPGDSVPPQVEPDPPAARSQRRREQ